MEIPTQMLERLDYRADAVGTGLEAISALARSPYDVGPMNCRMPERDGYEATRRIRQGGGRFSRSPIIGVPAYALKGGHESCLAAAMDDCMSKPIPAHDLALTPEKWPPPADTKGADAPGDQKPAALCAARAEPALAQGSTGPPPPSASEEEPVDVEALSVLQSMEDEGENLLVQLIDIFLADMDERLDMIRGAVERGEAEVIRRTAHAIKGSCGHFGAKKLAELCKALEQQARSGTPAEGTAAIYRRLAAESARVRRALEEQKALVIAAG